MAIAYSAVGAGNLTATDGADLNLTCPATVAVNDILIAHVYVRDTSAPDYDPATPSGWSKHGPYDLTGFNSKHWFFAKLADGTEDGASVSFGSDAAGAEQRAGRIYSFSGYVSGVIDDVVPPASITSTSSSNDPGMPTVTTTVTGALAVVLYAITDDNVVSDPAGESGGNWAEAVAEYSSAALQTDFSLGIFACTPTADPGTVSGGSTDSGGDGAGLIGFEIRPNAPVVASFVPTAIFY